MQSSAATVLLVEDEVLVRTMLAEALTDAGYSVVEAGDAEEAVHVLRASKHIDLIVTDIRMPGSMDGIALATLARSERPGIKIVLVSGDLRGVDSADYDGVFLKPYDVSGLLGLVGTLTTKEDRPTPQNCCP